MRKIRVMIIDDHQMVRHGLRSMLAEAEGIEVIGEASTSVEALRLIASNPPDVALVDIRLPAVDGIQVTQQIRQLNPRVRVIILTAFDDDQYLFGALKAGARGYLLKNITKDKLEAAVNAVYDGERMIGQDLMGRVLGEFERISKEKSRYDAGLSQDEMQVLILIAQGATSKEIAERVSLSEITVKRKVQDICRKLEASNRTQAVVEAMRRGII